MVGAAAAALAALNAEPMPAKSVAADASTSGAPPDTTWPHLIVGSLRHAVFSTDSSPTPRV
ncbi:hypothetical protein I917_08650 [Mycobacterium tuberculosis str. Haarlem/NITR202]|uniref:Uncharacterized protein n=1 Tax=Mycobacterium tuberculosis str. Haarlem/NITR202 TaxID=1304279 RepID=R4M4Q7_MYCTX|nr:hypothetical protein I917_08650 [Mycobacterium tuberculosis str. Haarlem/NITR202]SIP67001.1 conserved exported hypothetical protein [Mycobacterium tuberculosis]